MLFPALFFTPLPNTHPTFAHFYINQIVVQSAKRDSPCLNSLIILGLLKGQTCHRQAEQIMK